MLMTFYVDWRYFQLALTKLIIYRSDNLVICQYCWQWRQRKVLLIFQWNRCKWIGGLVVKVQYAMSFMKTFYELLIFQSQWQIYFEISVCVCVAFLPSGKRDKNKSKTKNYIVTFQQRNVHLSDLNPILTLYLWASNNPRCFYLPSLCPWVAVVASDLVI